MLFRQLNTMDKEWVRNKAFDEVFDEWWDCDFYSLEELTRELINNYATEEEAYQVFVEYFKGLKESLEIEY